MGYGGKLPNLAKSAWNITLCKRHLTGDLICVKKQRCDCLGKKGHRRISGVWIKKVCKAWAGYIEVIKVMNHSGGLWVSYSWIF